MGTVGRRRPVMQAVPAAAASNSRPAVPLQVCMRICGLAVRPLREGGGTVLMVLAVSPVSRGRRKGSPRGSLWRKRGEGIV